VSDQLKMKLARNIVVSTFIATAGAAGIASCTNGTNYDGSYVGGFAVGDGGSTIYSVPANSTAPQIARNADGSFGAYFSSGSFTSPARVVRAYFSSGSFTSPATVTISPPATGGAGGQGQFGVTITGATSKKPYIVFFGNNNGGGNQGEITDQSGPLGVQVQANGVFFGLVSSAATNGAYSRGNQMNGTGTNGFPQTLPQCLQQCQLGSSNGQSFDYCFANTTTGNNGDTEKLFDCVIACGEPAPLANMCKTSSARGQSVQCGTSGTCSGASPFCCQPMGGTTEACSPNATCAPGNYSFGCDGSEDCSQGQVCCIDTTGTHCGACDVSHQVCHAGGSGECSAGSCSPVTSCSVPPPFQLATCGILPQCPLQGGTTVSNRNVPCSPPMGQSCKGNMKCIVPKNGGSPFCGGTCDPVTSYCFECLGHNDCGGDTPVCCAFQGGTQCLSGCAPEGQVCTSDGAQSCPGMTGCPGSPLVCQPSDYPNTPQLLFCNPPSTCPVMK
jgi:hypothetical protein